MSLYFSKPGSLVTHVCVIVRTENPVLLKQAVSSVPVMDVVLNGIPSPKPKHSNFTLKHDILLPALLTLKYK